MPTLPHPVSTRLHRVPDRAGLPGQPPVGRADAGDRLRTLALLAGPGSPGPVATTAPGQPFRRHSLVAGEVRAALDGTSADDVPENRELIS